MEYCKNIAKVNPAPLNVQKQKVTGGRFYAILFCYSFLKRTSNP